MRARRPDAAGPARRAAFRALVRLEEGKTSRLREQLDTAPLQPADRALATELAMGCERLRLLLDAVLCALLQQGRMPDDIGARISLRLGAYQVLFLPRMPAHAAVHSTVELVRPGWRRLVNGVLRAMLRQVVVGEPPVAAAPAAQLDLPADRDGRGRWLVLPSAAFPDPGARPAAALALRCGLPAFLVERWIEQLGRDGAEQAATASAVPPSVFLRARLGRIEPGELAQRLLHSGVETEPAAHERVLRVLSGAPMGTPEFAQGLFSVQDPTALAAVDALRPQPGETILDLCAAPGGKATAAAELLRGEGVVLAHDVDPRRLARVAEAGNRLRLGHCLRLVDDLARLPELAPNGIDAALVDAPCSNTGVLARRVEVRRRLQPDVFAELARQQRDLLARAATLVRPGGRVAYSTCSLEPEENRAVVDAVIAADPSLRLVEDRLWLPQRDRCDGGYCALLHRAGAQAGRTRVHSRECASPSPEGADSSARTSWPPRGGPVTTSW